MRKFVRVVAIALLAVVLAGCFSGCGTSKKATSLTIPNSFDEQAFVKEMAEKKTDNVNFAINGESDFVVVYPDELNEEKLNLAQDSSAKDEENDEIKKVPKPERDRKSLKDAVDFLTKSLSEIVGCEFASVENSKFLGGNAIKIQLDNTLTNLKNSGYALSIQTGEIVISALDNEGLRNGIYSFLEQNLGCMFVSAEWDYLPRLATINLEKTNTFHNPDMVWREVYAFESERNGAETFGNAEWCDKLKLNGAGMGGWGNWCHTFFEYIKPAEYFETHPEYFSEIKGERIYINGPVSGQLCLTNEDVYKIISEKMFALMEKNPDIKYWDVSQMDTWINRGTGCQCANCKKLDDEQDSPMGSLLTFVNRIADECAIRYPENYISTLAYNYSAKPPKTLKPRDNVIIKLCFMPGDVTSDIKTPRSKNAESSKKIIQEWSAISKNLLIWDYNVNFHQYLMPYPIYSALQVNNDFYLDSNVYGVFHQMDRDKGGYSAELSAYVFSQIMWDKTAKVEDILAKYLSVYYGKAAQPMIDYYNAIEKNAVKANRPLYIYSTVPDNSFDYLSIRNVNKYLDMFADAEKLAGDDATLLARIKKAKLGVLYVKAQEMSLDKNARLSALNEFKQICDENGIESLYEGNPDFDNEVQTFYDKTLQFINIIPWVITATVVGCVAVVAAGATIIFVVLKKSKAKDSKKKEK